MGSELKVQLLASRHFVQNIGNLFDPLGNMVWLQLKVYSPPAAGSDWGNVFRLHSGVTDKTFFFQPKLKYYIEEMGAQKKKKKQALIWLDERLIESFTHFQLQSDFGQICVWKLVFRVLERVIQMFNSLLPATTLTFLLFPSPSQSVCMWKHPSKTDFRSRRTSKHASPRNCDVENVQNPLKFPGRICRARSSEEAFGN